MAITQSALGEAAAAMAFCCAVKADKLCDLLQSDILHTVGCLHKVRYRQGEHFTGCPGQTGLRICRAKPYYITLGIPTQAGYTQQHHSKHWACDSSFIPVDFLVYPQCSEHLIQMQLAWQHCSAAVLRTTRSAVLPEHNPYGIPLVFPQTSCYGISTFTPAAREMCVLEQIERYQPQASISTRSGHHNG